MPRSRPLYPEEYRQQMVDLVRSGRSPDQLAARGESRFGAVAIECSHGYGQDGS